METNIYSPRQFGQLIGRCTKTLQRWDKAGVLIAGRYPNGRRFYTRTQYAEVLGLQQDAKDVVRQVIAELDKQHRLLGKHVAIHPNDTTM